MRQFGSDITKILNIDTLKNKALQLKKNPQKENPMQKKIQKLKKKIELRKDKNFRKKLRKEKKKKNLNKKLKGIKGMKVTPKLEFKTIPDALNSKSIPLDSHLHKNTKLAPKDPRTVNDINKEITRYLKCIECVYKPSKNFMNSQKFITKEKREQQVDWILRLSHEMRLKRQTFYLAVSMMDRYIELKSVTDSKEYDSLALTCLFSAAKYEELTFPTINDFVYLSAGSASKDDLVNIEMKVLETLGWRLNYCNPMGFFDQLARNLNLRPCCYHFGQFLVECLIYKGKSAVYKNSVMGAACLLLCLMFYDKRNFKEEDLFWRRLEDESLYTKPEVYCAAKEIWGFIKQIFSKKSEMRSAVMEKFKKKYYSKISQFLEFEFQGLE